MDFTWGEISESLGEAWDVVYDVTSEVVKESVQTTKESGKDTEQLRANEPVKGKRADGSPIVVQDSARNSNQAPQYINGVDNTVVIVGGVIVTLLVVMLSRGGK